MKALGYLCEVWAYIASFLLGWSLCIVFVEGPVVCPPCKCEPVVCDPPLVVECPARLRCPAVECVCEYPKYIGIQEEMQ